MKKSTKNQTSHRIGILTFQSSHNYGAMLQAYALQRLINSSYPNSAKIIDYVEKDYKIFTKPTSLKSYFLLFVKLTKVILLLQKKRRFLSFHNNYMDCTRKYSSYSELEKNCNDFDIYISGSDQVFNPRNAYHKAYYLNFISNKLKRKIAYSPSFGLSSVPDIMKAELAHMLNDFDSLSCRETEGANIIKELTGKVVDVTLDPVFLLDPKEWLQIESNPKGIKGPYILVYALVGKKKQIEIARKVKQITGLQVVLLTNQIYPYVKVDKSIFNAGPREFVWLFRNAEFVVTDSFHGTAFSLTFLKNFYSIIAIERASSRIRNILSKLGLTNRIIKNPSEVMENDMVIEYKEVNKLVEKEKRISKSYLFNAIK